MKQKREPSEALAHRIELYLLANPRWVKSHEIVRVFNLTSDRALRADGDRPGLLSAFAISSSGHGFMHVKHASDEEFEQAYRRMRGHGLSELVGARRLRKARHHRTEGSTPLVERATGQMLLPVSIHNPSIQSTDA